LLVYPKISPTCFQNANTTRISEHKSRIIDNKADAIGLPVLLSCEGENIGKIRCHKSGSKKNRTDWVRDICVWLGLPLLILQIIYYTVGITATLGAISMPALIPIIILLPPIWTPG